MDNCQSRFNFGPKIIFFKFLRAFVGKVNLTRIFWSDLYQTFIMALSLTFVWVFWTVARVWRLVVVGMIKTLKWPETLMLAACWHCSGYWAAVGAHWLLMKDSIVRPGGAHAVATWRPRHTCPVLSIHVIMFLGHVTRIQRLEILRSLSLSGQELPQEGQCVMELQTLQTVQTLQTSPLQCCRSSYSSSLRREAD